MTLLHFTEKHQRRDEAALPQLPQQCNSEMELETECSYPEARVCGWISICVVRIYTGTVSG